jgi:hypothetical protein
MTFAVVGDLQQSIGNKPFTDRSEETIRSYAFNLGWIAGEVSCKNDSGAEAGRAMSCCVL